MAFPCRHICFLHEIKIRAFLRYMAKSNSHINTRQLVIYKSKDGIRLFAVTVDFAAVGNKIPVLSIDAAGRKPRRLKSVISAFAYF